MTVVNNVKHHVTTEMLIDELTRIRGYMETCYPKMVEQNKITPYARDERLSYNKHLLSIVRQLQMLEKIHGMPYNEILQHIQAT